MIFNSNTNIERSYFSLRPSIHTITMTSKAVERTVEECCNRHMPFLQQLKKQYLDQDEFLVLEQFFPVDFVKELLMPQVEVGECNGDVLFEYSHAFYLPHVHHQFSCVFVSPTENKEVHSQKLHSYAQKGWQRVLFHNSTTSTRSQTNLYISTTDGLPR